VGENGILTVAIGDATGHGLKAGTMVSVVKSLFVSLADHPEISHIFERHNSVLKEIKLRGLFMAMTMIKVQGRQMSFSIAGMPPILLYRQATGAIEEVMIKAMPLGGITGYQYKQQDLSLSSGDVVVLMSDGLPERFNEQGEMLDYQKIHDTLLTAAQLPPEAIINRLIEVGDEWGGSRMQDDDVTFVVVKVR
jgi:serine phosphatase RsbU (regulator of sigma subunit)